MTSFIAWVGVDARGPASVYFASDSRLTWGTDTNGWDCGMKLFASKSQPEIFGFVGYAMLPQSVLRKACDAIDHGLRAMADEKTLQARVNWLRERVKSETSKHPNKYMDSFTIFHGIRLGSGMPFSETDIMDFARDRESVRSYSCFYLFAISWDAKTDKWTEQEICIPQTISSVLKIDGTGTASVGKWSEAWKRSDQGDTSRTVFSGFCDSLSAKEDPYSGGYPQLVGLYRIGSAKIFGVVTNEGPTFQGERCCDVPPSVDIEWRDYLFQRVGPDGVLLTRAKRHSRPKNVDG